jgi:hypothetical protein
MVKHRCEVRQWRRGCFVEDGLLYTVEVEDASIDPTTKKDKPASLIYSRVKEILSVIRTSFSSLHRVVLSSARPYITTSPHQGGILGGGLQASPFAKAKGKSAKTLTPRAGTSVPAQA